MKTQSCVPLQIQSSFVVCLKDSPFVSLINEGGHSPYILDKCLLFLYKVTRRASENTAGRGSLGLALVFK